MPKTAALLARGHLVFAAIPAVFLLATGFHAVRAGFVADLGSFTPARLSPRLTSELIQVVSKGQRLRRTVGVWGLGDKYGDSDSGGYLVLNRLIQPGTRIQIDASWMPEALRRSLPKGVTPVEGPYAAAKGADLLVILGTREEYRRPDLFHLAEVMKKRVLLDGRSGLDPGLPGLELFPDLWVSTIRSWPSILDPELRGFVDEVARRVPPDGSILLVPRPSPLPLLLGRWFLPLNYLLFPRKLYLVDAAHAGGTNPEFRKWTLDAADPKFDPRQAAREVGAGWLLECSLWIDFRPQDFALKDLRGGPGAESGPDSR